MLARGRRAERGDCIADAVLGEHDHVHVALDDEQFRQLAFRRLLGLVQAEQVAALVEQRGLGRVQILRRIVAERAATEADSAAARVADREHHAVAEAVVGAAAAVAFALDQQAGVDRMLKLAVGSREQARQRVPGFRRIADREALRGLAIEPALLEIVDRRLMRAQLCAVELLGCGERVERAFEHEPVRRIAAFARHVDADAAREFLDGLDEAQPVVLHQEGDRRAVPARGEVEEHLLRRIDEERWRFLVRERRQALVFAARALEFDARADHFDDVDAREQVLNERVWDSSAGHALQFPVSGGRFPEKPVDSASPLQLVQRRRAGNAQPLYPSLALISPDSLPMSVRPATCGFSQAMTLPMSFMPAAPVSAMPCAISAATSSSLSACGR